jgi:hypothetical protein
MEAHKQKLKALEKMAADYTADREKKQTEHAGLEKQRVGILANPQAGAKVELQRVLAALDVNAKEINELAATLHATSEEMRETQKIISQLENDKAQKDAERENLTLQEKINALWAADLKRRAEVRVVAHKLTSRFWEISPLLRYGKPFTRKIERLAENLAAAENIDNILWDIIGKETEEK